MKAIFTHVFNDTIIPNLKDLGFKRSGSTFIKVENGFSKIVAVQLSQWNTNETIAFTIEVGVYFPNLYSKTFNKELCIPHIQDCIWQYRRRINQLKGSSIDSWYEIKEDTDVESLTREIAWDIKWYIRRHFLDYQSLHDFYTK